jgi:hypothetical protein
MKDGGKAVLILGGVSKLVTTQEGRADAYQGKAKREFYKALFDQYNVVDMFTVSGDLYEAGRGLAGGRHRHRQTDEVGAAITCYHAPASL